MQGCDGADLVVPLQLKTQAQLAKTKFKPSSSMSIRYSQNVSISVRPGAEIIPISNISCCSSIYFVH
jgi:hypothetical protein